MGIFKVSLYVSLLNLRLFKTYRVLLHLGMRLKLFTVFFILTFCGRFIGLFAQQDVTLDAARKAYAEENYTQTITLLDSSSHNFETLLLLGDALQKTEKYYAALRMYNKAAKLNKKNEELLINRGSAKIWTEQFSDALKDLKSALSINDQNYRTHYYIGIVYYYEFKNRASIKALDECISLNPDYAPAYYLRAACSAEMNRVESAIDDYQKAYDLDKSLTEALFNIAVLKFQEKNYFIAQRELTDLLDQGMVESAELYFYRAECSYYLNDKQAACKDYNEARKRGDSLASEIYDKYCTKNQDRKQLPERKTESISL